MQVTDKFKIGVWVDTNYQPTVGGGFGYYSQVIKSLRELNYEKYNLIFTGYNIKKDDFIGHKVFPIPKYERKLYTRMINKFYNIVFYKFLRIKKYSTIELINNENEKIKKYLGLHLDLIYYPTSTVEFDFFPFINTLWDLGHKISYSFPELTMNGNYEARSKYHDLILNKALIIFCESNFGKNQLQKYFHINEDRIKVIPIFPSDLISQEIKEAKPSMIANDDFFIHYPAQFWAHKNHYNLLVSFVEVLKLYPNLKLFLTGADKGNMNYIRNLILELKLNENVQILGFIEIEELKWIYKKSQGLVMPSLLGPTSMPLLEAASLGCKVACSNIEGHFEQLGEYAIYFDALNAQSIANSIIEMIETPVKPFRENKFSIENSFNLMNKAFEEVIAIRRCWGRFDKIK